MSEIKEFFGDFSLFTADWFYGLCALIWGFFVFIKGQREKIDTDKDMARQKNIENNFNMKKEFRSAWERFIALPDASKEAFQMPYETIQDENTRVLIINIISILHDVHVYHQMSKSSIEGNLIWMGTFDHVFDDLKHKSFIEAFRKMAKENHLSKEFVKYVEEIIKQNQRSINNKEQKAS